MKKALKKHLPLLSLLLLLLVWGLWYTRPVNFFDLNPDLEATSIHGSILQYGEIYEQIEHLSFDIDADSPQGQSLLADLEAIRVRHSPLNPLRTFYWNHLTDLFPPTLTARQSESGQYQYALHVMGNGDWIALQFNLDEWEYDMPEQPNYFPCRISDGIAFGQSLGDKLMELAKN